jgi:hypothetical protein
VAVPVFYYLKRNSSLEYHTVTHCSVFHDDAGPSIDGWGTNDKYETFTRKERTTLSITLGFLVGGFAGGAIGGLAGSGRGSVVVYEAV